jgi:hypothetical protein
MIFKARKIVLQWEIVRHLTWGFLVLIAVSSRRTIRDGFSDRALSSTVVPRARKQNIFVVLCTTIVDLVSFVDRSLVIGNVGFSPDILFKTVCLPGTADKLLKVAVVFNQS